MTCPSLCLIWVTSLKCQALLYCHPDVLCSHMSSGCTSSRWFYGIHPPVYSFRSPSGSLTLSSLSDAWSDKIDKAGTKAWMLTSFEWLWTYFSSRLCTRLERQDCQLLENHGLMRSSRTFICVAYTKGCCFTSFPGDKCHRAGLPPASTHGLP